MQTKYSKFKTPAFIHVGNSENVDRQVQRCLFKMGYQWYEGKVYKGNHRKYYGADFCLFAESDGSMSYSNLQYFNGHKDSYGYTGYTAAEFLELAGGLIHNHPLTNMFARV